MRISLLALLLAFAVPAAHGDTQAAARAIEAFNQGTRYMNAGMLPEAVRSLTESIEADPNRANSYVNRALCLISLGRREEAIRDLSSAVRLAPEDRKGWYNRGLILADLGRHQEAIHDFTATIRINTRDAVAFNNRGKSYFSLFQYERALANFNAAIRLNPRYANAYHNRAITYRQQGDLPRALLDLKQTILIDNDAAAKWSAHLNRAGIHTLQGNYDSAVADVRSILGGIGWRSPLSQKAVLLGHFAHRRLHQDTLALGILLESARHEDSGLWPNPLLRYLRGEWAGERVFAVTRDTDFLTEAHTYIGLDLVLTNRIQTAIAHLLWVRDLGSRNYMEWMLANAILSRITYRTTEPIDSAVISPRRRSSPSEMQ